MSLSSACTQYLSQANSSVAHLSHWGTAPSQAAAYWSAASYKWAAVVAFSLLLHWARVLICHPNCSLNWLLLVLPLFSYIVRRHRKYNWFRGSNHSLFIQPPAHIAMWQICTFKYFAKLVNYQQRLHFDTVFF